MKQIERVLKLADKGFSLFPLSPLSKIPTKNSNGVSDATNNRERLLEWHAENPNFNWGIAGGRITGNDSHYLIVVDVDTKEGKNGKFELEKLVDTYGEVPQTLKIRTHSGGLHYYFKTRIMKNHYARTIRDTKHIDIKSEGGYLVLWGSETPTGKYQVESGHIDELAYLEDWFGEDTEKLISPGKSDKSYLRQGTIARHDGRWAYITSWAGKFRADGLKGEALFQALLQKRDSTMEVGEDDRFNDLWIKKLADNYSGYPDNFPPTDQGNADRFLAVNGSEVLHSHELGWHVWTGKQWERDMGEKKVMQYAGDLIQIVNSEIYHSEDKKHKKVLEATRRMLSMHNSRKNALSIAKVSPLVSVRADQFDTAPFLFNVDNGIINLTNGEIIKHSPEMRMTKIAPIMYAQHEEAPLFNKFMDEITLGDTSLKKWLQVYFGYAMTADVREQLFAVFHGSGGNGKTVLVNVISHIMGQYTLETPVETIINTRNQKSASNDIARIKGARLITVRESDQGHSLAESLIKSLTGGDKITARFLHREFFEFRPVAKWILFTNHKPTIRGTDKGIWRRVKLVPFNYSVPDDKKDKMLEPKLLAEAQGILNWLIEGCLEWQKNGFPKCDAIDNATNEYQEDEDRLGEFLTEAIQRGPNYKVSASELYKAYRLYCRNAGEYALNTKNFGKELAEKGFSKRREAKGNFWLGIGLTDEYVNAVIGYDEKAVNF